MELLLLLLLLYLVETYLHIFASLYSYVDRMTAYMCNLIYCTVTVFSSSHLQYSLLFAVHSILFYMKNNVIKKATVILILSSTVL